MADVFVSYKRSDEVIAVAIQRALEAAGYSVWRDNSLSAGEEFDLVINRELHDAQQVVVIWSQGAADSKYVRAEAKYALEREKLIFARSDATPVPVPFNTLQNLDLVLINGDLSYHSHKALIGALEKRGVRSQPLKPDVRELPKSVAVFHHSDAAMSAELLVQFLARAGTESYAHNLDDDFDPDVEGWHFIEDRTGFGASWGRAVIVLSSDMNLEVTRDLRSLRARCLVFAITSESGGAVLPDFLGPLEFITDLREWDGGGLYHPAFALLIHTLESH